MRRLFASLSPSREQDREQNGLSSAPGRRRENRYASSSAYKMIENGAVLLIGVTGSTPSGKSLDHSEGDEYLPGVVEKTSVNFHCAHQQLPSRYPKHSRPDGADRSLETALDQSSARLEAFLAADQTSAKRPGREAGAAGPAGRCPGGPAGGPAARDRAEAPSEPDADRCLPADESERAGRCGRASPRYESTFVTTWENPGRRGDAMSDPTATTPDPGARLEEAMAEYLMAADAGRAPDPAAFLARYPDLRRADRVPRRPGRSGAAGRAVAGPAGCVACGRPRGHPYGR